MSTCVISQIMMLLLYKITDVDSGAAVDGCSLPLCVWGLKLDVLCENLRPVINVLRSLRDLH